MMEDELKNYHAEERDGFSIMEPQQAGALLFTALAVALFLERLGVI